MLICRFGGLSAALTAGDSFWRGNVVTQRGAETRVDEVFFTGK